MANVTTVYSDLHLLQLPIWWKLMKHISTYLVWKMTNNWMNNESQGLERFNRVPLHIDKGHTFLVCLIYFLQVYTLESKF